MMAARLPFLKWPEGKLPAAEKLSEDSGRTGTKFPFTCSLKLPLGSHKKLPIRSLAQGTKLFTIVTSFSVLSQLSSAT